jgi:hypothetical protein
MTLDRKAMFGRAGRFLKAEDVPEPKIYTIDYVQMEEMKDQNNGGMTVEKPVVTFVGCPHQLVLNVTNYDRIADALEQWDVKDWRGKRIELVSATGTMIKKGEEVTYTWLKATVVDPASVEAEPKAAKLSPLPPEKKPADGDFDFNDSVPF